MRVLRAYSGYIEYVGAKLSASRPGPPKACSSCCITSLDPLAAQTMSGVMPLPPEVLRYAGELLAQRDELAVGVAVELDGASADRLDSEAASASDGA